MARIELNSKTIFQGQWIRVIESLFDTGKGVKRFEIIERDNTVVVIPCTSDNKILFLKHFRYPTNSYSVELPMGGIDHEETELNAAQRELMEETGIKATNFEKIGTFYPVPGLTSQVAHVFLARLTNSSKDVVVNLTEEDTEEGYFLGRHELEDFVKSGLITDGFTLSATLLYLLQK